MQTLYQIHPAFALAAPLPLAEVALPLAVHDGDRQTLNEQQLAAIEPLEGRCVVNSGAGTGKSTVLTARMLAILQSYPEARVLMLTFSRKAALELRNRIQTTPRCTVSTLHSICYHILRDNGYKDFRLNTSEASREACITQLIGKKTDTTVEKVVRSLNRLTGIDQPTETIKRKYFNLLLKIKELTFDAMQPFALQLLEQHQNILHALQAYWDFLLVDESQDCDEVQQRLIQLLTAQKGNVCLVGDDRQSIYGFRGAVDSAMTDFANADGEVTQRTLTVNYRSTPPILGLANRIMYDHAPLTAANAVADAPYPAYLTATDAQDEARHVIETIQQQHKAGQRYRDMAILYRSSSAASAIMEALLAKQIPFVCKSAVSLKMLHQPYALIVWFLRYALQPDHSELFAHILPAFYLRKSQLKEVQRLAKREQCSLIHAATLLDIPFFQREYIEGLADAAGQIAVQPPQAAVETLLKAGLGKYMGAEKTQLLTGWAAELTEYASLPDYLSHVDELIDRARAMRTAAAKAGNDAVQVMTIHAAKGLEFDTVYLIGCADGILPSTRDDADIEEERRLLYVAVTRAKRQLYISYPLHDDTDHTNTASRFLQEAFSRA